MSNGGRLGNGRSHRLFGFSPYMYSLYAFGPPIRNSSLSSPCSVKPIGQYPQRGIAATLHMLKYHLLKMYHRAGKTVQVTQDSRTVPNLHQHPMGVIPSELKRDLLSLSSTVELAVSLPWRELKRMHSCHPPRNT